MAPLPKGDVLIHCGDFTGRGSIVAVCKFAKWMGEQDFRHKLVIMGNHEVGGEKRKNAEIRSIFAENGLTYLEDSGCEIEGIKIYGSPVQPRFFDWEWNRDRGADIRQHWDLIPEDTQLLISHGPPYGVLDSAPAGGGMVDHVGCEDLLARIKQLPNLKLHAFGHIHAGYGHMEQDGVVFANAATCTEAYKPTNLPIEVELTEEKAFVLKRESDFIAPVEETPQPRPSFSFGKKKPKAVEPVCTCGEEDGREPSLPHKTNCPKAEQ